MNAQVDALALWRGYVRCEAMARRYLLTLDIAHGAVAGMSQIVLKS
jgi:hypothetical protein